MKRRAFLKRSAAASVAAAAPLILSSSRLAGAAAPSDRVSIGFIGLGNQSRGDLPAFLENDDVQVVAVCDVNEGSYGYNDPKHFLGRKPGLEQVLAHYSSKSKSGTYKACEAYTDFRDVIARDDIDAVVLVVPDHWHAIMTIMAADAGKDVYCEKPLSLTLNEGKLMVDAIRRNKRMLQTGSQHRSGPAARQACELVLNQRIGKLVRIETYVPENNAVEPGPGWKPEPVPAGFDYNTWLGPAPLAPYHAGRCLYRFRFNLDYSGGQVTNFGTHMLDIAQWGHGSDDSGPVAFEDTGSQWPEPGSLYTTATRVAFKATYADGVELTCETKPKTSLCRFVGTDGWVQYQSGKVQMSEGIDTDLTNAKVRLPISIPERTENDFKHYLADHVRNFINSVKSREEAISPVSSGHRTASICHLGNIAMQLKRAIKWEPETESIVGDEEASAMLSRTPRGSWGYGS